ncbi:hypothetical protein [Acinetobacter beijerinckii]|uniref:Uncharacterized protein n=1 Tax=Acinetobacter beijerinckii CIP 110307 TaxID=1217648 RepID=N9DXP8_9GAMM|nr:hypothetical protein [Acinetobacter beijerinckii]ENW02988.1 hypothetical protein F933_03394 [Acinetobacter beijerinckii CIP 110307]
MKTNTNQDLTGQMKNEFAPVELSLSGLIPKNYTEYRFFHCRMCGEKIDQKQESIINHSMLCTGY